MTHINWQEFLTSQGAHWENNRLAYFGDEAGKAIEEKRTALNGEPGILCDLSHYSLIRASGADSASFLQNQFCNDVRNVSSLHSQLNAYCTPKGRVLAFFRLFQRGDDYYLRLPQAISDSTLKRLRMFVLMSKVELGNSSDELLRIGYAGANAGQRLATLLGDIPREVDAVSQHAGLTIICLQAGSRYEIHGDETAIKQIWRQLSDQAMPAGADAWELLDIHAALPEVFAQTQEAFVPQMLNLQAINALSFKKGCYPGQEIVARMHYLGKLKRRMFIAHTTAETPIQAGDALYAEGSGSSQGVGKVVRAQTAPDGGTDLLAVIEISSAEERKLHLQDDNGPQVNLLALPYPIEEAQ